MLCYAIAFDPGYRNFGVCIKHTVKGYARIYKVDLATWGGVTHTLTKHNYGIVLYEYLSSIKDSILSRTSHAGIEDQPPNKSRDIFQIQCQIEAMLLCMCPRSTEIGFLSMASARSYFNIKGKNYMERKLKSFSSGVLSSRDLARYIEQFGRGELVCGDGLEAAILLVYMTENTHKLKWTTRFEEPRKFAAISMYVDALHKPASNKKRNKTGKDTKNKKPKL